jgi:FixJ family two-component response regulator
MSWILNKTFKF